MSPLRVRTAGPITHDPTQPVPAPPSPWPGHQPPDVQVRTPMVYVAPAWEYEHVACALADAGASSTIEMLRAHGADGWELTGVVNDGTNAHFYFKREVP